jgi:hypothetical protein
MGVPSSASPKTVLLRYFSSGTCQSRDELVLAVIGQGQRNETRTRAVLPGAVPSLHDRWLTEQIARLEEVMMPLLERCHRMMARSIAHLDSRRRKPTATSVTVGQAGQVNVDCDVSNEIAR